MFLFYYYYQSKIIYTILVNKKEYMSLVYIHITATIISVAYFRIKDKRSGGICSMEDGQVLEYKGE